MQATFKATLAAGVTAAFVTVPGGEAEAEPVVSSWYGPGFEGSVTASGEVYEEGVYTAAHPDLPFGTELLVTYGERQTVVRVNDRGPHVDDRGLDLSQAGAEQIGLSAAGTDEVDVQVLEDSINYDSYLLEDSTNYDSYLTYPSSSISQDHDVAADESGSTEGYKTRFWDSDVHRSNEDHNGDGALLLEPRPYLKFWARRSPRIRDRLLEPARRPR
jgi:rare lipoprotein A